MLQTNQFKRRILEIIHTFVEFSRGNDPLVSVATHKYRRTETSGVITEWNEGFPPSRQASCATHLGISNVDETADDRKGGK